MNNFSTWLDTFVDEKGIDREQFFTKHTDGFWGTHIIEFEALLDQLKGAPADVQDKVRRMFIAIDFKGGDPMPLFDFLAQALADAAETPA